MTFKTSTTADINMTSCRAYISAPFSKLKELFGAPIEGEDKVSTEWNFEDDKGRVVTLYDYKMTERYSAGYMSVETFRALPSYEWHIGARNKEEAEEFKKQLEEVLK